MFKMFCNSATESSSRVTRSRIRMRLGSASRRRFWSIDGIEGSGLIYQHIWIARYKCVQALCRTGDRMSSAIQNITAEYKVADMTLAEWGRKEISIAEQEMP